MSDPSSDRLQELRLELEDILDTRLSALSEALRDTERATRRVVAAEIEIERTRARRETLEAEVVALEATAHEGAEAMAAVTARHDELTAERQRLSEEATRLELEVVDADSHVEQTRSRVAQLEAEAETLRSENAGLKAKLKTLEENIARMRRLKEELMSSISGLTQQMTGLAGGSE